MKKLFRCLCIVTSCIALFGCVSSTPSAVDHHETTARIDPALTSRHQDTGSQLEEYVSRVGKKMLMVSSRPSNIYHFAVVDSNEPVLQLDPESHTITISNGTLHQLKDEAELAAVLGLGVARLNQSSNIDRETATTMSYAGYDPSALVDVQEQYFYSNNQQQNHWLQVIYPAPISAGTIAANKVMVQKMSKGLLRDSENYQKQIND